MYTIFILLFAIMPMSCNDDNANKFGPRPTRPEKGKGALITQYMLSADEAYKSWDE